jgi:hypothetical protein
MQQYEGRSRIRKSSLWLPPAENERRIYRRFRPSRRPVTLFARPAPYQIQQLGKSVLDSAALRRGNVRGLFKGFSRAAACRLAAARLAESNKRQ